MRRLCFALFFSCLTLSAFAQSRALSTQAEIRKVTDRILENAGSGNYDNVWKLVKSVSVLRTADIDATSAQFASQQQGVDQTFGKPVGYEFIRDQQIGTSLIRFQYIQKFTSAAMRWSFIFYRTTNGWVLTDFKFDSNTNALFSNENN